MPIARPVSTLAVSLAASLTLALPTMAQDPTIHARAVALHDEIREGGPAAVSATLDAAARQGPLTVDLLLEIGSMLHWTSQGPSAVAVLERATTTHPGSARAWKDLGDARAILDDAADALAAYRRAAATAPSDPALSPEARDVLARSARRHALLLERADLYAEAAGAYREADGATWILRYDPYLALFPTLLVVETGEYLVLRPTDDPRVLDYSMDSGLGAVALVEGAPSRLRWTPADGISRHASRLPIEVRSVEVVRPDVRLSGTILVPAGGNALASIALLPGGGVLTRHHVMNEAWLFAANGLAALVWDRRGTGRSVGVDWSRVGFDDLVADAGAMIERLRAETGVDPDRVGLWGHSQGGWHAPMLAADDPGVAFVILAAGPASGVHRQLVESVAARMRSADRTKEEIDAAVGYMERLFAEIREGASVIDLAPLVAEAGSASWGDAVMKPELAFEPRWWRQNDFDPAAVLAALRVPVLALFGARDDVVPIEAEAPAMASHLARALTEDFTIQVVPRADHALMTPEGRLSPSYTTAMVDWLRARGLTANPDSR